MFFFALFGGVPWAMAKNSLKQSVVVQTHQVGRPGEE